MSMIARFSFSFLPRSKVVVSFVSSDAVALTFDDGPDPIYTPRVLEVLRKHGARATFFVLGRQAELYPRVVQQILRSGCEVANHSYSHPSFSLIPLRERVEEIRRCQSALGRSGTTYFRPPFGHSNFATPFWAGLLGYRTVCWSADANDWESRSPNEILKKLEENVQSGSILLLHDRQETASNSEFFNRDSMIEALDAFLGKSRLAFKSLSEMFGEFHAIEGDWDRNVSDEQLRLREHEYRSLLRNSA